jgi:hypothetical protein
MTRAIQRRRNLLLALDQMGIQFREDSIVCKSWIQHGKGGRCPNLDTVVLLMCQAKYLHEYCNFDLGYEFAMGAVRHNGHRFPRHVWYHVLRQCVLSTTTSRCFPYVWPWLQQIPVEPRDWLQRYDASPYILSPSHTVY